MHKLLSSLTTSYSERCEQLKNMVDGSYSQFKATKGRKADRDFKKERLGKKKPYFNLTGDKSASKEKRFSREEIETTKTRMRQRLSRARRRKLLIVLITLALIILVIVWIIK